MNPAQKHKEDEMRGAIRALRLLEGSIPDGAKGLFYQTPTGWLLDYGQGAEVDLPPLSKEEVFILVNVEMSLPFALCGDGPSHPNINELVPGLRERRTL